MKPLALLIPGLDGTGELFYRQHEALGRRYRVRTWAYAPGGNFDLAALTREIGQATVDEIPGSILVVGDSFGSLVALAYVLDFPERVRRLILINGFPYYCRRLMLRLGRMLAPLLPLNAAQRLKEFVVDRTLQSEGIPAADRNRYREIVKLIDPAGYRRRLQLLQEIDLRPRLAEIKPPTVLLASGRDKIVPSIREAHFMAARIPCARVYEFPSAGHALLLTPGFYLADYDSPP